ncbi:MAG: CsbD family protein [Saccharofermentanales bacterium]
MTEFNENMNEFNKKMKNKKNKFSGEIKEAAGRLTGNEQLELKGRIQSAKANFNENMNVKDNINDVKESIAKKINDRLDKKKK